MKHSIQVKDTLKNNSMKSLKELKSQDVLGKKQKAKLAWEKLEKWIQAKQLKIILILEGDENKTSQRLVKNLKKWSTLPEQIKPIKLKHVDSKEDEFYFPPLLQHLPKAGQIAIFENCWYQKSIDKSNAGKWDMTLWESFSNKEKSLQESGYILLKYAFKNKNQEAPSNLSIFEILQKTEIESNPVSYFNCWEKKSEVYSLIKHLVKQIPHEDLTFPHKSIDLKTLQQRAYNLRWATLNKDIIPLTAADPDFPVAPEIRKAIKNYTSKGYFSYGPATGLPEFKEAASHVLKNKKGINCPPELILPTDSAASAMYTVAKFALQPGDEAIIFDPVDFLFQKSIEAAGGKVIRISLDKATGTFNPQEFTNAISKKTKMIGLCNPHNPTGRVWNRQELLFIGSMAAKHDLWIMNDEIWSDIVYPQHEYINIASLHPEIAKKTISIYGFSKTFGLAGLRVGFIAAPSEKIFDKILRKSEASSTAGGVSTLSQIAATAAYQSSWYWADNFLEHLTKVRDYALNRLNQMPGIDCRKPEGTYLLFPNIQQYGMSSEEITMYLLKHAKVAVVPGAARWFGPGAEGHIRMSFATSMEIMKEAMDRIEVALSELFKDRQAKMEKLYFKNFDPEKVKFQ